VVVRTVDFQAVPCSLIDALCDYAVSGTLTDELLRAALENDLRKSVRAAHPDRPEVLPDLVGFIETRLPAECFGSPEKVSAWIAAKGASATSTPAEIAAIRKRIAPPKQMLARGIVENLNAGAVADQEREE